MALPNTSPPRRGTTTPPPASRPTSLPPNGNRSATPISWPAPPYADIHCLPPAAAVRQLAACAAGVARVGRGAGDGGRDVVRLRRRQYTTDHSLSAFRGRPAPPCRCAGGAESAR